MCTFKQFFLLMVLFCMGLGIIVAKVSDKPNKKSDNRKIADDKTDKRTDDVSDKDLPELEKLDEEIWPPKGISLKDDPAKWPGHLDAFGSIGKIHKVDVYKRFPKPTVFFSDYVAPYIPLVMRGAVKKATAFKKWADDEYFLNLPQAHTQWFSTEPSQNITFMKFVIDYKTKKLVYDKEVPAFLSEDVPIPSPLLCDPVVKSFSMNMLNIYGYDFSSPISRRNVDTIRCVFAGKQDFVLVSNIDFSDVMPSDFDKVDVRKVNYKQYPSLRQAEYHKVTVNSGDCIFIPTKWYWQQNCVANTKAVDVTWYHKIKNVKPSECLNYTATPTLNMVDFPDQISLTDSSMLIAIQHFSSYLISSPSLTYKHFEAELKKDKKLLSKMLNWTDEFEEITVEVFQLLDINSDQSFSVSDLQLITPEKLTKLHPLLDDLLADYQDILTDQQEDTKESAEPATGKTVDATVKEQLGEYMSVLEDVIKDSIEEFSVTGKLPDMEKRLGQKIKSLGGKPPTKTDTTTKTARQKAKEQLKGKKQKVEEAEDVLEFTEAEENYKVIDESVVEEIIVDDDLPEVESKSPEKQAKKKPDVTKKEEEQKKKKEKKEKKPEKSKTKQSSKKVKSKHEEL
ncbi:uncharacterized protein LOC121372652 [Gigantopelta aegis]|uniref:uncharacterized protein LOC121372652 n=1 Tax=Gigantopelta aegis TaxID=1735272 RepID=UPI001B88CEA9|nr:uncharacterized protein LOC121372652 [Gigantopelta aegis]